MKCSNEWRFVKRFFPASIFSLWYVGGTVYVGERIATMAMTTPAASASTIENVNVLSEYLVFMRSGLARVWLNKHIPIITNKRHSGNAKWEQATEAKCIEWQCEPNNINAFLLMTNPRGHLHCCLVHGCKASAHKIENIEGKKCIRNEGSGWVCDQRKKINSK